MRSLLLAIHVVVLAHESTLVAQNVTATIRVEVRASEKPVEGAEVVVAGATHRTDNSGLVTVTAVAAGSVEVNVVKSGFAPATASVQVAAGAIQHIVVDLQPQPALEETVTVVASTRTDKRLEDQPMRVGGCSCCAGTEHLPRGSGYRCTKTDVRPPRAAAGDSVRPPDARWRWCPALAQPGVGIGFLISNDLSHERRARLRRVPSDA